jgi:2-keto-4-pentenoate hydratase/2-oxohepta-3-ene-1,7-dioic acid hydratase in catechol pathway
MLVARITHRGAPRFANIIDGEARLLSAAPWLGGEATGDVVGAFEDDLLAPLEPSKIVCVGRSYRAHAEELGNEVPKEPLIFLKPPSALLAPGGTIVRPKASARVDFEGEVAVVIGERTGAVSAEQAAARVFGITCANDVTARDLQRKDVQFTRGKGFDTFCPCGPWIATEHPPLDAIEIETRVDGEVRQRARTDALIWSIPELIAFIGGVMTLEPGDVILTGTPEGVGPLGPGQRVEVEVSGVGVLENRVEG